ncbi:MAG: hypothetical protein HQK78_09840 [Desulfobacterales bacterium]|nr:hypothetical protein [Desulfobacterales bacterium]
MVLLSEIQKKITEIRNVFSKTAISSVEIFFQKESKIYKEFEIVEQLSCEFDYLLIVSSVNSDYQSILVVGINNKDLSNLLNREEKVDIEEASDIIGEFGNNYCGLLADDPDFTKHFGILTQGMPIVCTNGKTLLNFIWGVEGKIYFNNNWMYFGYAINKRNTYE